MMKTFLYLFYTEWLLQVRRAHDWLYPLFFFLMMISFFPIAFSPDVVFLQKYMPGCIWLAALLASLLSIENTFLNDLEQGSLEQQMLSQLTLTSLISIKLFVKWLVLELPLILILPVIALMFHLTVNNIKILTLSLLLGTPILVLIASLGAALLCGLKKNGLLLGLLIFPLSTPILIFGVSMTQQAQMGFSVKGPLMFLAGCALLAITLLPITIAATLRISMDD